MTDDADSDTHPTVPYDEQDGRHIDYETETCNLCGGDILYLGGSDGSVIRCAESDETLQHR